MKTKHQKILLWLVALCAFYFIAMSAAHCQEQVKFCTIPQQETGSYTVYWQEGSQSVQSNPCSGNVCNYFFMQPGPLSVWVEGSASTMIWIGQRNPWSGLFICLCHPIVPEGERVTVLIGKSKEIQLPNYQ